MSVCFAIILFLASLVACYCGAGEVLVAYLFTARDQRDRAMALTLTWFVGAMALSGLAARLL